VAEATLRVQAGTDLSWIGQGLDSARRRFDGISPSPQILSAVYNPDDGRLSCVVRAATRQDVQRLFEIALLPSARVVEVVLVQANTPGIDLD
jgi:hypothetical protein